MKKMLKLLYVKWVLGDCRHLCYRCVYNFEEDVTCNKYFCTLYNEIENKSFKELKKEYGRKY